MELPPGYRFVSTDSEVLMEYLQRKVKNEPIPIPIQDINLKLHSPMALAAAYPKIGDHEWYFFTPRDRKYPNGMRPDRAVDSGYWKATGANKEVLFEGRKVGFRKSLVFYQGETQQGVRTDWIMHEFGLDQAPRGKETPTDMRLDDWVLCRIYEKPHKVRVKRKACKKVEEDLATTSTNHGNALPSDISLLRQEHYAEQQLIHHHANNQPIFHHDHVNTNNTFGYGYGHDLVNTNNIDFGYGYGFEEWNDLDPNLFNYNIPHVDELNGYLDNPAAEGTSSTVWNNEANNNNKAKAPAAAFPPSYPCSGPTPTNIDNNIAKFGDPVPIYIHDVGDPVPVYNHDVDEKEANVGHKKRTMF